MPSIQIMNVDAAPRPLLAACIDVVSDGFELHEHRHQKCELIYTAKGVLNCEADGQVWTIPPKCAIWIPSNVPHRSWAIGRIEAYALFVDPRLDPRQGEGCCAIAVSPLLRELLFRVVSFAALYPMDGPEARLLPVVLDELGAARREHLRLPLPTDPDLRRLTDLIISDPSHKASVGHWAARLSMTERTLARRLNREIGMSLGQWRRRFHVARAMQWMADGRSVKSIAFDLGYESTSSFVTMFRKTMGKSPARYFSGREEAGD
jgi:AraC-like DNA-binding protein